ncbi:MAG: hypothetical protein R3F17_09155 [Planctomycetota bacterium]
MSELLQLWLPILLSALAVFIASSILHMVIPIHANDNRKLPNENEVLPVLGKGNLAPGTYMFPHCGDMKNMGTDEMIEKYQRGPVGFVTIMPTGTPNIGKSLLQWFVFTITVSVFCAYVGTFTLAHGADYMRVFRLIGTVAFLGYGWGVITESIWKGQPWSVTMKFMFDGLVYALVTAGVFGSMWPAAS